MPPGGVCREHRAVNLRFGAQEGLRPQIRDPEDRDLLPLLKTAEECGALEALQQWQADPTPGKDASPSLSHGRSQVYAAVGKFAATILDYTDAVPQRSICLVGRVAVDLLGSHMDHPSQVALSSRPSSLHKPRDRWHRMCPPAPPPTNPPPPPPPFPPLA